MPRDGPLDGHRCVRRPVVRVASRESLVAKRGKDGRGEGRRVPRRLGARNTETRILFFRGPIAPHRKCADALRRARGELRKTDLAVASSPSTEVPGRSRTVPAAPPPAGSPRARKLLQVCCPDKHAGHRESSSQSPHCFFLNRCVIYALKFCFRSWRMNVNNGVTKPCVP